MAKALPREKRRLNFRAFKTLTGRYIMERPKQTRPRQKESKKPTSRCLLVRVGRHFAHRDCPLSEAIDPESRLPDSSSKPFDWADDAPNFRVGRVKDFANPASDPPRF